MKHNYTVDELKEMLHKAEMEDRVQTISDFQQVKHNSEKAVDEFMDGALTNPHGYNQTVNQALYFKDNPPQVVKVTDEDAFWLLMAGMYPFLLVLLFFAFIALVDF